MNTASLTSLGASPGPSYKGTSPGPSYEEGGAFIARISRIARIKRITLMRRF